MDEETTHGVARAATDRSAEFHFSLPDVFDSEGDRTMTDFRGKRMSEIQI